MSRSVDRIEMLVMNMLTFSRDRQPERSVTDIGMLIRDVFAGLQIRAEKVKVELDSSGLQAGRIDVDPHEIFRVIQNLTLNAIEACERRGGRVSATCVYDPEGCTFAIADTGEGIPAHIVPRLSQAFVTTKGSSGTGLGLACTYKIIHEHGGSVSVDTAVGRGTTFTIQLPHVGTQGRVTAQGYL
jgi:signal transduction histidine kinase